MTDRMLNATYHKVCDMLNENIDEIFLKMQEDLDINSGDIDPLDELKLTESVNDIAMLITKVLAMQKRG